MRIVIHLDKRTASAPCLYDYEFNAGKTDPPILVEYGRYYMGQMKKVMASTPGFEESRRPLRGVPAAIMRFNQREGRFDPIETERGDFAPRIRVALANFMSALSKELDGMAPAQADVTPAACAGCIHCAQRAGMLRSVLFRGRYTARGKLLPYCKLTHSFLDYDRYANGCDKKGTSK